MHVPVLVLVLVHVRVYVCMCMCECVHECARAHARVHVYVLILTECFTSGLLQCLLLRCWIGQQLRSFLCCGEELLVYCGKKELKNRDQYTMKIISFKMTKRSTYLRMRAE